MTIKALDGAAKLRPFKTLTEASFFRPPRWVKLGPDTKWLTEKRDTAPRLRLFGGLVRGLTPTS